MEDNPSKYNDDPSKNNVPIKPQLLPKPKGASLPRGLQGIPAPMPKPRRRAYTVDERRPCEKDENHAKKDLCTPTETKVHNVRADQLLGKTTLSVKEKIKCLESNFTASAHYTENIDVSHKETKGRQLPNIKQIYSDSMIQENSAHATDNAGGMCTRRASIREKAKSLENKLPISAIDQKMFIQSGEGRVHVPTPLASAHGPSSNSVTSRPNVKSVNPQPLMDNMTSQSNLHAPLQGTSNFDKSDEEVKCKRCAKGETLEKLDLLKSLEKMENDLSTSLSLLNETVMKNQQDRENLDSANQQIKQLEDQLEFANQKYQDLSCKNAHSLQQMELYKQELKKTQEQLTKIQAELFQDIEVWKVIATNSAKEKIKLENQIQLMEAQILQLKKEMELYNDSIERVEIKFQGVQQCIQTKEERIIELEENAHCSQAEIDDLKSKLEKNDELSPYYISELPIIGGIKGSGSYGSVYHIQLNGISCIAKRLHDILLGQGLEEQVSLEDKHAAYQKFQDECILLSSMRHPNIVQFMGVHYGPQRDYGRELTLVMECLYINLEKCLVKYPNIEMWMKISILLDVSRGLLHLHSLHVIHRDLTAPNILLTTSFHAKIADLGVSKIIDVHPLAATKQSMIPGTLGYMPPEALSETPEYSFALDIFSFGVVMLFVLIQQYPQYYENTVTTDGVSRKEIQIDKRMKWISKLSQEDPMRLFICQCLKDDPDRRPCTKEVNSTMMDFSNSHPKPFKNIVEML